MSDGGKQADELKAAIAGLEAQRFLLGDAVVDPALAAVHQQDRDPRFQLSAESLISPRNG